MKTLEGYKKYQVNRIAYLMQELCERRGYGIGEVGYNINEEVSILEECHGIPKSVASDIKHGVEDRLELAQEHDMELSEPYPGLYEDAQYEELEATK